MTGPVRITGPLLDVLEALIDGLREGRELHGWAIMKDVQRSGPTVYGVLDRLEAAGWITSRWEDDQPVEVNRPRRRFYRLTPHGASEGARLLDERRPARSERGRPQPGLALLSLLRFAVGGPR